MKDETVKIRISKTEKESLIAVAEKRDVPVSQIVREAVRKEISDAFSTEETKRENALAK